MSRGSNVNLRNKETNGLARLKQWIGTDEKKRHDLCNLIFRWHVKDVTILFNFRKIVPEARRFFLYYLGLDTTRKNEIWPEKSR